MQNDRSTKVLWYVFKSSVVLGPLAGLAWLVPIFYSPRFAFTSDFIFVFFVSTLMTALFLFLICLPLAKAMHASVGKSIFCLAGACIGAISVIAYTFFLMDDLGSISRYFLRFWREMIIFSVVGFLFFFGAYDKLKIKE